jgi:hypothetical protein
MTAISASKISDAPTISGIGDVLTFLIGKYPQHKNAKRFFEMMLADYQENPQGFHRVAGQRLAQSFAGKSNARLRRELCAVYEDVSENYGYLLPASHFDLRIRLETILYQ